MIILAIDTSGDTCSVAIGKDQKLISNLYLHDKNTHSINLMPMIDNCLKLSNYSLDDIDAFAVAVGPGSFTGIRIGVCTIKGLAHHSQKPCIAVNTLDGLTQNQAGFVGTICPLIDARRCESYFAYYNSDGRNIKRISAYGAEHLDEILKGLPEENICFMGDGAINYRNMIEDKLKNRSFFLDQSNMFQSAKSILKQAFIKMQNNDYLSSFDIMPYYHRVSQAERMKANNDALQNH